MKPIIGVIAPFYSSGETECKLPPIVDRFSDELVREVLVRLFRRLLPCMN